MEAKFFSAVMILITLLFADGDEGSSVTARAPTSRKTANGEIAHFTCTLKYNLSSAEITWQKQGHNLRDGSSGVVIISWNNGTILESHLLVAVTDDDERRGTYTCVGTDEDGQSRRSFVIQGQAAKKLSDVDYTAIGVAIGIFLCLSTVILVYLVRGRKRLQEGKLRTMTTISHSVTGHDNAAVEEGENTSAGITLNTLTDQSPSSKDSKL
ncbi:hypothetical protein pdam_00003601 [Pocillopora damicornis]|uniref:Ig-like domain-containing protein n=1 Tax=Pocillopora damicornis TaxID=46731 RepID=A0A3M6V0S0_POCDA|nr:uncharacterized protein LOC113674221 [Pocillopora damicornis]XP_058967888.1 uncharacterized protein LOC131794377 [Pocillopora verrucosa]RMX59533.1 hypothetical protein pdam_00003601 [Pocillopora damicornis]